MEIKRFPDRMFGFLDGHIGKKSIFIRRRQITESINSNGLIWQFGESEVFRKCLFYKTTLYEHM